MRFHKKELEYAKWCNEHSKGFVFNHFGGKDANMNVIHLVNCRSLRRKSDEGMRTKYEKICSIDQKELEQEVTRIRETSWKYCGICMKKGVQN